MDDKRIHVRAAVVRRGNTGNFKNMWSRLLDDGTIDTYILAEGDRPAEGDRQIHPEDHMFSATAVRTGIRRAAADAWRDVL